MSSCFGFVFRPHGTSMALGLGLIRLRQTLRRDKLGLFGFVLGSFWVRFWECGGVVYCRNPLSNRSLSSFLAFRKLGLFGFELGLFWVRFGFVFHCPKGYKMFVNLLYI